LLLVKLLAFAEEQSQKLCSWSKDGIF